jgi:hypothetical protein
MLIFGSLFYTKYMNKMNLGNLVKNLRSFFFFFFFFLQLLVTIFFFFFSFIRLGSNNSGLGPLVFSLWGLSCEVLSFSGIFFFFLAEKLVWVLWFSHSLGSFSVFI